MTYFNPRTLTSAFIVLSLSLTLAAQASLAGFGDDVRRAARQFDRDLCKTFDLKGCPRTKPAGASKRTPERAQALKPPKPVEAVIPVPRQKPVQPAVAATPAEIPIPRAKPAIPVETAVAVVMTPVLPAPRSVTSPEPPTATTCQLRLRQNAVEFSPKPMLVSTGRCTLTDPVELRGVKLNGEALVFPDNPVLNCAFAETFVAWIAEKGDAVARREAKSGLASLHTGPGFECRTRNGDGSGKLSEHGSGNAVDITMLKLRDGRVFQVADALDPVTPAYQTLKSLRFTACEHFSTVLGPGSNAAHAEHFHFDNGRHGKTGTYRICE